MSGLACDSVRVEFTLIRSDRHDGPVCKSGRIRRSASRKGGADLLRRMRAESSVCLRRLGKGHAGEVRYSRFLNSRRVTAREMLATVGAHCASRVAGRHALAVQDTSEVNYQAHAGRAKGLGLVGNGTDLGFFVHPVLCVDAQHGGIIGLAGGAVWKRDGKVTEPARLRAIEDKESRRWIDAALASAETLDAADAVTAVCDREGDIFELFAAIEDARSRREVKGTGAEVHLLVRAAQDRGIVEGGQLFAHAEKLCSQHSYTIDVPEKPGQNKRKATVALGFGRVHLKRPARMACGRLPGSIGMTLVVVREINPPQGCEPVRWVLLTTHEATTVEAAMDIVGWYRKRWLIEQLFRLLKTQGFNVEESQVVEGHALMNLVTAALVAAMQTLQLTLARDGTTRQPIGDAFDESDIEVLGHIEQELPGKTAKQSNPHGRDTLAWAVWIIARLGGWTGYASQKPPGPKTMYLGLKQFENIAHGWNLSRRSVWKCGAQCENV